MRRLLVLLAALALVGTAGAQKHIVLPNGNTIDTLADGEIWATLHPHGKPLAMELSPDMPVTGQFETQIVYDLPPSDIVNAPQSIDIDIWGYCQSNTYTVIATMPFSGKMRGGYPEEELATGSEEVMRRVEPDSPISYVFAVACEKYYKQK